MEWLTLLPKPNLSLAMIRMRVLQTIRARCSTTRSKRNTQNWGVVSRSKERIVRSPRKLKSRHSDPLVAAVEVDRG